MSNAIWKRSNATWTVEQFFVLWDKLNLRPEYQREFVWNRNLQQELISSILSDAAIPQIMLWKKPGFSYDVIDGQQRLQTIYNFFSDEFTLMPDTLFNGEKIGRMTYSTMPREAQMAFHNYTFFVHIIDTDDHDLIIKQFLRLQSGRPLTKQDKRDAQLGTVKEMLDIISQHEAFDKLYVRERAKRTLALRLLVLEHYNYERGPDDSILDAFHIKYHGIGIDSPMAQSLMAKVDRCLTKMERTFANTKELPSKWHNLFASQLRFLDAYSLLDMLEHMGVDYDESVIPYCFAMHVDAMESADRAYYKNPNKKDVGRERAKAAVESLYRYGALS